MTNAQKPRINMYSLVIGHWSFPHSLLLVFHVLSFMLPTLITAFHLFLVPFLQTKSPAVFIDRRAVVNRVDCTMPLRSHLRNPNNRYHAYTAEIQTGNFRNKTGCWVAHFSE